LKPQGQNQTYILATGTINDPVGLSELRQRETEVPNSLKEQGLVLFTYRFAQQSGIVTALRADNFQEASRRMSELAL
jgi:hypothetical protein